MNALLEFLIAEAKYDYDEFVRDWKSIAQKGGSINDFLALPKWSNMTPEVAAATAFRIRTPRGKTAGALGIDVNLPKLQRGRRGPASPVATALDSSIQNRASPEQIANLTKEQLVTAFVKHKQLLPAAISLGLTKNEFANRLRTVKALYPKFYQNALAQGSTEDTRRGRRKDTRRPSDDELKEIWNSSETRVKAYKEVAARYPDLIDKRDDLNEEENYSRLLDKAKGFFMDLQREKPEFLSFIPHARGSMQKLKRQALAAKAAEQDISAEDFVSDDESDEMFGSGSEEQPTRRADISWSDEPEEDDNPFASIQDVAPERSEEVAIESDAEEEKNPFLGVTDEEEENVEEPEDGNPFADISDEGSESVEELEPEEELVPLQKISSKKERASEPKQVQLSDDDNLIVAIWNVADNAKDAAKKLKKLGYDEAGDVDTLKKKIKDLEARGANVKHK